MSADDWVELDVCGTCLYGAAYDGDGLTEDDQATLDGLAEWAGWHLMPACEEECDEGFTWSACDICGQTGRSSHTVMADPVSPQARQSQAAETYVWGFGALGWKAIPGADTYRVKVAA